MLPTLNLSLLSTAMSPDGIDKSAFFSMGSDQKGSEENPFQALFQQLEIDPDQPLSEQDLSAVLSALTSEIGESLPLGESVLDAESETLILVDQVQSEATEDPLSPSIEELSPETMTGDELISYLMANAGLHKDGMPKTLELPVSDSFMMTQGSMTADQSDQVVEDESADFLTFYGSDSDDGQDSEQLDSEFTKFDTSTETLTKESEPELGLTSEGAKKPEEGDMSEEGLTPQQLEEPVAGEEIMSMDQVEKGKAETEEVVVVTAAPIPEAKSKSENQSDRKKTDPIVQNIESDLEGESDSRPQKENLTEIKQADIKTPVIEDKQNSVKPGSPIVTSENNVTGANKDASTTSERTLINTLASSGLTEAESVIDESLAKPALESVGLSGKGAVTRPLSETVVQQSVEAQLSRPMKLALASQALAERIQTMMAGDIKQAFIRLDPPELGSLELRVQVHQDQTQVQIVTHSAQVREALEQHSARLREALAEQGLNLSNLDVSDQQSGEQRGSDSTGPGMAEGDSGEEVEGMAAQPSVVNALGLVDHYV